MRVSQNPLPYTCPTKGESCSWQALSFEPPCPETVDRTLSDTGKCSGRDPFNTLIVDELRVPAHLKPGECAAPMLLSEPPRVSDGCWLCADVLSIRWDCEKSAQIWSNCGATTPPHPSRSAVLLN